MKRIFSFLVPTPSLSFAILLLGPLSMLLLCLPIASNAHAAAPITPSGLNTQVNLSPSSPAGKTQYDITGGTRPGGGANLFHSFGDFNVPTNNIANFLNDSGLATSNILGRVTGGNISNIFGTIQTTGFGNANLFLMNPAGFLFGPNATINVGGMMTFTTADYLRLADGVRFNAVPDAAADALLSTAPVAAFGFLSSNPAAINFVGGQLTVAGDNNGTGVALVGGNISLTPDTSVTPNVPSSITAPGRSTQMTSVAGPGEVAVDTGIPTAGMAQGTVTLGQGTTLSTVGNVAYGDDSGGAVSIRGGQLVATGAKILTNFATGTIGHGGDVTIVTTGSASFSNSSIDTRTIDPIAALVKGGDGGAVSITASDLTLTNSTIRTGVNVSLTAPTPSTGAAGAVTLTGTNSVTLTTRSLIDTQTFNSSGNGGAVTVTAPTVTLVDSVIQTGVQGNGTSPITANGGPVTLGGLETNSVSMTRSIISTESADTEGNSGSVTITGQTVTIGGNGGQLTIDTIMHNDVGDSNAGNGGDIQITGTNVTFTDSAILNSVADTFGTPSRGGNIRVNGAQSILLDNGTFFSTSTGGDGSAGNIELSSQHVTITGQSQVATDTFGTGSSGTITITGTQNIALESGSSITTTADFGSQGAAGPIQLNTPQLTITGGSLVSSQSFAAGPSGTVTIQGVSGAAQSVLISDPGSGVFTGTSSFSPDGITSLGTGSGGNIFVHASSVTLQNGAIISAGTTGIGNAGNILVKADSVNIQSGAQITSNSSVRQFQFEDEVIFPPTGNAGTVTIQGLASPTQSVLIDGAGSGIFTNTQASGAGGDISITANTVTVQNGGELSAQTTGAGNAGNILVQADSVSITGGAQLTSSSVIGDSGELPTGNAGTVTIQGLLGPASSAQSVLIDGSQSGIFTETQGSGAGGNINFRAKQVTLSNSATLSTDTIGTSDAGAITITADESVSLLSSSTIESTSVFGNGGGGGPVTITAPIVSLQNSTIVSFVIGFGSDVSSAAAGSVTINAPTSLSLAGNSTIDTSVQGTSGNAGRILITSPAINLSSGSSISSESSPLGSSLPTDGNAGVVELDVGQLSLANRSIITTSTDSGGQGGSITVHGLTGTGSRAEDVTITSGSRMTTNAGIPSLGSAGNITVDTARLALTNGGSVQAITSGPGSGGTITIHATEQVTVSGEMPNPNAPGQIFLSQIAASSGPSSGPAGNIIVGTPNLTLADGGSISATTKGPRSGGSVTVQGLEGTGSMANSFTASGQTSGGLASGIFTNTSGTGAGGNISVNANTVTLQNGGTLSAATSGPAESASGGTITVNANQVQVNSGGLITAATSGAGAGGSINIGTGTFASNASTVSSTATQASSGDITIAAGQSVTLNNGSLISSSSTGAGNAGNIMINAGRNFISNNSSVTTQASQASGGTIKITTTPNGMVELINSTISASVLDGTGGGGSVNIDPQFVILQNSQILAQAVRGPGGNISITTNLLLPDANSVISASSQSGVNGTVTVQSPNAPATGKIIPLSQKPLTATALLSQRCAALASGEFSSFTVAGRDSLPAEPGGWLASPLALATSSGGTGLEARGEGQGVVQGERREAGGEGETPILSLRQIAPPGFLTQAFAVDWSAGCTS